MGWTHRGISCAAVLRCSALRCYRIVAVRNLRYGALHHSRNRLIKFCSNCGAPVTHKIPPGDSLPRHVCDACNTIHYQNPKIVVGCIPEWEDRILLCKRAIEPRYGLWTVPAGFMENREPTYQGAVRETLEEANARGEVGPLHALYN